MPSVVFEYGARAFASCTSYAEEHVSVATAGASRSHLGTEVSALPCQPKRSVINRSNFAVRDTPADKFGLEGNTVLDSLNRWLCTSIVECTVHGAESSMSNTAAKQRLYW